ncbi:MAG: hypothetical protein ACI9VI_002425 [Candidatus Azotimanducaceae bacterium]|jgi:hypothetical protein
MPAFLLLGGLRQARTSLPDTLLDISTLGNSNIVAIDASYQERHMHMAFYDERKGIPLEVNTGRLR